jgi:Flp pilus assembly protein TadD
LLERRGEDEDALAAYRRADERGDARGTHNLGLLLIRRGDRDGAIAAFTRAASSGAPGIAEAAREILAQVRRDSPQSA